MLIRVINYHHYRMESVHLIHKLEKLIVISFYLLINDLFPKKQSPKLGMIYGVIIAIDLNNYLLK